MTLNSLIWYQTQDKFFCIEKPKTFTSTPPPSWLPPPPTIKLRKHLAVLVPGLSKQQCGYRFNIYATWLHSSNVKRRTVYWSVILFFFFFNQQSVFWGQLLSQLYFFYMDGSWMALDITFLPRSSFFNSGNRCAKDCMNSCRMNHFYPWRSFFILPVITLRTKIIY